MTVRLVVYGLLRRGAPMNDLLGGARFLGELDLEGYRLYDLGEFPGVVPGAGSVRAELWELASPAVLAVLDEAERVHEDPPLYRRELVDAQGAPAWLYVYAQPVAESARIASGDWLHRP